MLLWGKYTQGVTMGPWRFDGWNRCSSNFFGQVEIGKRYDVDSPLVCKMAVVSPVFLCWFMNHFFLAHGSFWWGLKYFTGILQQKGKECHWSPPWLCFCLLVISFSAFLVGCLSFYLFAMLVSLMRGTCCFASWSSLIKGAKEFTGGLQKNLVLYLCMWLYLFCFVSKSAHDFWLSWY